MLSQTIKESKLKYIFRRSAAGLIDGMVIFIYAIFLFEFSMLLNSIIPIHKYMSESYLFRHLVSLFTLTAPTIIYFVLMEKENSGASLGKKLLGLKVASIDGTAPEVSSLWVRNILKFLPWEIAHTTMHIYPNFLITGEITSIGLSVGFGLSYLFVFIYLAMVLIRKDKRSLYEIISDTSVVRNS